MVLQPPEGCSTHQPGQHPPQGPLLKWGGHLGALCPWSLARTERQPLHSRQHLCCELILWHTLKKMSLVCLPPCASAIWWCFLFQGKMCLTQLQWRLLRASLFLHSSCQHCCIRAVAVENRKYAQIWSSTATQNYFYSVWYKAEKRGKVEEELWLSLDKSRRNSPRRSGGAGKTRPGVMVLIHCLRHWHTLQSVCLTLAPFSPFWLINDMTTHF